MRWSSSMIKGILISYFLFAVVYSQRAIAGKWKNTVTPHNPFVQRRTFLEADTKRNYTTDEDDTSAVDTFVTNTKKFLTDHKSGGKTDLIPLKENRTFAGIYNESVVESDFEKHPLPHAEGLQKRTVDAGLIVIHLTPNRKSVEDMQHRYVVMTENQANESIEFLFDDLQNNVTNNTLGDRDVPIQIIPVCQVGNQNCTKCKAISPLCHFMYSEGRCVFHNSTHASKLYECAKRWFPVDKNEAFIATIVIVILISAGVAAYLSWIRLRQAHGNVDVLPQDELSELRQLVVEIREKRLNLNTSDLIPFPTLKAPSLKQGGIEFSL